MNKVVDYLTWGFILLFASPTILIMASWSSLPGEPMFGIKRSFESGLLAVVRPSYDAETSLNEHFTRRRLEEAKVLLSSKQSNEGLSQLSMQVAATKIQIQRAPTVQKKREAAKKYISTLQGVSQELNKQAKIPAPRKSYTKVTANSSSNPGILQTQMDQTAQLIRELEAQLQRSQQSQSQMLLAQLRTQAQQLQSLRQQVTTSESQQSPAVSENVQQQIQQQVENVIQIQQQVEAQPTQVLPQTTQQAEPTVPVAIAETQQQIEDVIEELEDIADDETDQSGADEQDEEEEQNNQGSGNGNGNGNGNNNGNSGGQGNNQGNND